jgi:hypothetical protein
MTSKEGQRLVNRRINQISKPVPPGRGCRDEKLIDAALKRFGETKSERQIMFQRRGFFRRSQGITNE